MKIAILTNFNEFNPGYSLTGVVSDQAEAFRRHGNEVAVYVAEEGKYNDRFDDQWPNLSIKQGVPRGLLTDYQSAAEVDEEHEYTKELAARVANFMVRELRDYDCIITHDWVLTGWNLPYAYALMMTKDELSSIPFLHWIHSIPCGGKDWWLADAYTENHKFITPAYDHVDTVMTNYRAPQDRVRAIPHIKDLRTWFDFCDDTNAFIDEYPAIMQSKVVCVCPASSDRLRSKNVHRIIEIIGAIKRRNKSACLVVPNQWSQGKNQRMDMPIMTELAEECDLVPGEDFIFTSEFQPPKFEMGVPRRVVRELMLCSNLFIFPTTHESFGLVAPEASLCGNYLVLNRDTDVLREIFSSRGQYVSFGSVTRNFHPGEGWEEYLDGVAGAIMSRMASNEVIASHTLVRRSYNMDAVYFRFYEPLIKEMRA